jgi:hypothetical protein
VEYTLPQSAILRNYRLYLLELLLYKIFIQNVVIFWLSKTLHIALIFYWATTLLIKSTPETKTADLHFKLSSKRHAKMIGGEKT